MIVSKFSNSKELLDLIGNVIYTKHGKVELQLVDKTHVNMNGELSDIEEFDNLIVNGSCNQQVRLNYIKNSDDSIDRIHIIDQHEEDNTKTLVIEALGVTPDLCSIELVGDKLLIKIQGYFGIQHGTISVGKVFSNNIKAKLNCGMLVLTFTKTKITPKRIKINVE